MRADEQPMVAAADVRTRTLLACQTDALERTAAGESSAEVLGAVAEATAALADQAHCLFLAMGGDGHLRIVAGPGLPQPFLDAIEALAPAGEEAGAWGRAIGDLAADHGMAGCWTAPVSVAWHDGLVGIVALCSQAARAPSTDDWDLLQRWSRLAGIVLSRPETQDQLAHQALHDPLTDLPNRTLFLDRLSQALGRLDRSHSMLAVLFLDVDRFKLVNDSLGHAAGDHLLVTISRRLSSVLRPGDTAARFGGDEFILLCENLTDPEAAMVIAERVAAAINQPVKLGSTDFVPSTSIGIALSHDRTDAPELVIRNADAAMYTAKERGRARVEMYDQAMRDRAIERINLEAALRRAIDHRELVLLYQPDVDLRTGRVSGVEALLRWDHPERGRLAPRDFLGVAEDTGLIDAIGGWALEEACRQVAVWWAALGHDIDESDHWNPPLTMRVNLSRRQLVSPDLVTHVERAMADGGTPANALCVEVAESALMGDVPAVAATLDGLKRLGVRIAIDDFGTGYSSLASLTRFPVDTLKVDRSFVRGLGHDPDDTTVVGAVINLAHSLGLDAVAEGVETAEQLEAVRELGCDSAQGFHIAPPAAAADVLALLRDDPQF